MLKYRNSISNRDIIWNCGLILVEDFLRNIFMGFVRVHLLYHASVEPIYGAEMMSELQRHGYSMSAGTLYPILHSMEAVGCLSSEYRVVNSKRRKYYILTPRGAEVLTALQKQVQELVHEVTPSSDSSPTQYGNEEAQ